MNDAATFTLIFLIGLPAAWALTHAFTRAVRQTREAHLQRIAEDAQCRWRADTDTWENQHRLHRACGEKETS